MNKSLIALTSFALGVGFAYVATPAGGRRRRARLRDSIAHSSHKLCAAAEKTSRDVSHRLTGVAARTLGRITSRITPSEQVLVARVRSRLGRLVSHPGAIEVTARDRVVTVSGPVFDVELRHLLKEVRAVPGVTAVENRLEAHRHTESLPALHGAGPLRLGGSRNWTPAGRLVAGVAGIALVALSSARRTTTRAAAAGFGFAGIELLDRALLGTRTRA